jgi:four helix bundle protein
MRRSIGVSRFEDLIAWQEVRKYSAAIGLVTDTPEFVRDGALRLRMNKTAVSIMENIAEGFERESLPEFSQFLKTAKGSTGEARAQLHRKNAPPFARVASAPSATARRGAAPRT